MAIDLARHNDANVDEIRLPADGEEISDELLLKLFLNVYHPGCRYLRRATVDLPTATGIFKADYTFVARDQIDIGHFSAFENVVCFNQLAFILFARAVKEGFLENLPRMSYMDLLLSQSSNIFILEMKNVCYRKAFLAGVEFTGRITIGDCIYKPHKNLAIVNTTFDFEDGKATGEVVVAMKGIRAAAAEPAEPALPPAA